MENKSGALSFIILIYLNVFFRQFHLTHQTPVIGFITHYTVY